MDHLRTLIMGAAGRDFHNFNVVYRHPDLVTGKRVLVVEDGPTLTHGEMRFGAGTVIAKKFGAHEIVDPRAFAVGNIADTYRTYPGIGALLPAMGYSDQQVRDLEATIDRVPCDVVIVGTPIDLSRIVKIRHPVVRARYELQEIGQPDLAHVVDFLQRHPRAASKGAETEPMVAVVGSNPEC